MKEPRRPTPYDLIFAGEPFETEHFPAIRAERKAGGEPVRGTKGFLRLARVGELMKELVPPDAPGVAIREYAALLYHGFRHWEHGRHVVRVDRETARALVEEPEAAGPSREPQPARPAGYVQLPRHLFWGRVSENATPEAVDGYFWVHEAGGGPRASDAGDAPRPPDSGQETRQAREPVLSGSSARLELLLVLGIMPNRAGFSVIEVGAPVPPEGLRSWADTDARPGGRDFENVLPGGELEGLFALVTELEALKLASRIFARIAAGGQDAGGDG